VSHGEKPTRLTRVGSPVNQPHGPTLPGLFFVFLEIPT